jgi:hypothetical protein
MNKFKPSSANLHLTPVSEGSAAMQGDLEQKRVIVGIDLGGRSMANAVDLAPLFDEIEAAKVSPRN